MKLSVYVPDELGEAVRKHKLPIATICQVALRAALQEEEQCLEQNVYSADDTSQQKMTTGRTTTSYIVTVTQIN